MALNDLTLWNRLRPTLNYIMKKPLSVTLSVCVCVCVCVCALKGTVASSFSCWDGRYKGSKGAMHCMLCMSKLLRQIIKAYNTFNAIYVNTVNTKHVHTFLHITLLIFNWFSKFWKAETQDFATIPSNTIYFDTVNTRSLMHSLLSMSTLLIQNMKVCNVFNAIYVDTVNTKH